MPYLLTLFVFICIQWCSPHIALCFVCLRLVCPMLPVSLDCPFLIVPSFFSNVYLLVEVSMLCYLFAYFEVSFRFVNNWYHYYLSIDLHSNIYIYLLMENNFHRNKETTDYHKIIFRHVNPNHIPIFIAIVFHSFIIH